MWSCRECRVQRNDADAIPACRRSDSLQEELVESMPQVMLPPALGAGACSVQSTVSTEAAAASTSETAMTTAGEEEDVREAADTDDADDPASDRGAGIVRWLCWDQASNGRYDLDDDDCASTASAPSSINCETEVHSRTEHEKPLGIAQARYCGCCAGCACCGNPVSKPA
eukprot:gnl/TRDRNA2_/TRDRNA2_195643_c0_seq1.p1 gnl/TRDRNA2_/TRDRNA2_195643_c0~~gnl/TRDRNA2_/TRDRNA2_195643_c0_seq1.p1  ORF type:complete len:170 (+),score=27.67 gnl/TRDRNA2_/TRDRNA2_195643_c0_seq1:78-587(+)